MENKKNTDAGAIWIKQGQYGDYLSISVEINGTKHNFSAFPNKYKTLGDKKPDYRIPAPRMAAEPSNQMDSHQSRIDFVNAEKAKSKAMPSTTSNIGTMMEQAGLLDESDLPF